MAYMSTLLSATPDEWVSANYDSTSFVKIDLTEGSIEFTKVLNEFGKLHPSYKNKVVKIQRIQHPFAYGRYIIRKEQLENQGSCFQEGIICVCVEERMVDNIIKYNADSRRMNVGNGNCILFIKTLRKSDYSSLPSLFPYYYYNLEKRDCERYIEYVIYL